MLLLVLRETASTPFHVVRAGASKPGNMNQRAAAAVSPAHVRSGSTDEGAP